MEHMMQMHCLGFGTVPAVRPAGIFNLPHSKLVSKKASFCFWLLSWPGHIENGMEKRGGLVGSLSQQCIWIIVSSIQAANNNWNVIKLNKFQQATGNRKSTHTHTLTLTDRGVTQKPNSFLLPFIVLIINTLWYCLNCIQSWITAKNTNKIKTFAHIFYSQR